MRAGWPALPQRLEELQHYQPLMSRQTPKMWSSRDCNCHYHQSIQGARGIPTGLHDRLTSSPVKWPNNACSSLQRSSRPGLHARSGGVRPGQQPRGHGSPVFPHWSGQRPQTPSGAAPALSSASLIPLTIRIPQCISAARSELGSTLRGVLRPSSAWSAHLLKAPWTEALLPLGMMPAVSGRSSSHGASSQTLCEIRQVQSAPSRGQKFGAVPGSVRVFQLVRGCSVLRHPVSAG